MYYTVLLGCSMALSLLTVPLLLPWLVEITGGKATGGPVAWQLALRRLQANGGDMLAAIAEAASQIERQFSPNSLNAILLSPRYLYGISWHDRDKVPAAKLRARGQGRHRLRDRNNHREVRRPRRVHGAGR